MSLGGLSNWDEADTTALFNWINANPGWVLMLILTPIVLWILSRVSQWVWYRRLPPERRYRYDVETKEVPIYKAIIEAGLKAIGLYGIPNEGGIPCRVRLGLASVAEDGQSIRFPLHGLLIHNDKAYIASHLGELMIRTTCHMTLEDDGHDVALVVWRASYKYFQPNEKTPEAGGS